jgi:hypothetical protein
MAEEKRVDIVVGERKVFIAHVVRIRSRIFGLQVYRKEKKR